MVLNKLKNQRGSTVKQKVGIIDFQDTRLDIPQELEQDLFAHYCILRQNAEPNFDKARFAGDYDILGAQRNTKILGIFARLAKRDNKLAYLIHIPRISTYLERNLHHPDLARLKAWYDAHLPVGERVIEE